MSTGETKSFSDNVIETEVDRNEWPLLRSSHPYVAYLMHSSPLSFFPIILLSCLLLYRSQFHIIRYQLHLASFLDFTSIQFPHVNSSCLQFFRIGFLMLHIFRVLFAFLGTTRMRKGRAIGGAMRMELSNSNWCMFQLRQGRILHIMGIFWIG